LTWNNFANGYSGIEPQSGKIFYTAQQMNSNVSTVFVIRFISGITPNMKVVYGTRVFNILAAIDVEERHKEMHLLCEEVFMNE
jgi:SPP1 family predicted phage head-tail adaptor